LWVPDGRHPDPAASQPIVDAIVASVRERKEKERVDDDRRKRKGKEARALDKKKRRLEERAELGDDEEALRRLDEANDKADHKSEKCSANWHKKNEEGRRCRKTAIYPNSEQEGQIRLWLDAVRCIKNMAIEFINATHECDLEVIRGAMGLTRGGDVHARLPARFKDVPRDVLDQAVRDCHKDCNSRLAQLKRSVSRLTWSRHFRAMRAREAEDIEEPERKIIKSEIKAEVARQKAIWTFKFHRKKDPSESMLLSNRFLDAPEVKKKRKTKKELDTPKYIKLFGGPEHREVMKTSDGKPLPTEFKCDCRLVHDKRLGTYRMCVTMPRPETQGPPYPNARVISLDPGVRTFMTSYNPTEATIADHGRSGPRQAHGLMTRTTTKLRRLYRREWGVGASIMFLARKARRVAARATADWVASRRSKSQRWRRKYARKARRKRNAAARIRQRSKDLVAAMHWRIANELCRSADVILLPDFRPSDKITRFDRRGRPRKIGKKTVNRMLGQSHSMFRQRLVSKAEEYGVHVEIVREDFTTRTCGRCGHDNKHVGSKKIFTCPRCRWTLGRDANGARNVMIRYVSESSAISIKRN
jgi:transposase